MGLFKNIYTSFRFFVLFDWFPYHTTMATGTVPGQALRQFEHISLFFCFCSRCCWCCCGAIYIVPWLLKTRPPTDFLACCFPIFPFFLRSLRNFSIERRATVGELQVLLKPCPQLVKNKQAKKEASRRAYGTLLTANDSAFVRCTFVMIFALFCPVRKTATLLFL